MILWSTCFTKLDRQKVWCWCGWPNCWTSWCLSRTWCNGHAITPDTCWEICCCFKTRFKKVSQKLHQFLECRCQPFCTIMDGSYHRCQSVGLGGHTRASTCYQPVVGKWSREEHKLAGTEKKGRLSSPSTTRLKKKCWYWWKTCLPRFTQKTKRLAFSIRRWAIFSHEQHAIQCPS